MFVVLLKFSENREQAARFMQGHKEWIERGLEDGVFLLAGSLRPAGGGAILAHGTALPDLRRRVGEDPFVAENVVRAEILEIEPSRASEQMRFLLG